jgi:hypothetical protein
VLSVPGAGTATVGAVVEVDDVVSEEVVCAKAPPASRNKAHVLAARYSFMVILHWLTWNHSNAALHRQRRPVFQVTKWEALAHCDRLGIYACRTS